MTIRPKTEVTYSTDENETAYRNDGAMMKKNR